MKKVILTSLVALAMVSTAFAQGKFNWDNLTSGGPILDEGGSAAGSSIQAELWYAPGAAAPEASLVNATNLAPVTLGNPIDGFFFGGEAVLPTTGTITVQIRAWDPTTGVTWEVAEVAPGGIWGKSNTADVDLVTGVALPNSVDGWIPFQLLLNIPEPSSIALASLAAVALLRFRQRD